MKTSVENRDGWANSQFSVNTLLTVLLLLSSDVELNPGPSTVESLRFACVSTQSAVQKTAIVHNIINELELDCLAMTETWIKQSHPDTIKRDPAPSGYTVIHVHRQDDRTGGGVAFIVREELHARQFLLVGTYATCDVPAVQRPVVE
jgi:hypothetical protein